MRRRIGEAAAFTIGLAVLITVAIAENPQHSVSTYSTFESGSNGYRALFNVLASEGVPVQRYYGQLALLPPSVRVIVFTDTAPERFAGIPHEALSESDIRRLESFARKRRILVFAAPGERLAQRLSGFSVRLAPGEYTNAALARNPQNAVRPYRLLAGRGEVAFDERLHGYSVDRSFWSALPVAVRAAALVTLAMLVFMIVGSNIRFEPAIAIDPPPDRDSSAYIRSVAALLRRSRGRSGAVNRFAREGARLAGRGAFRIDTRSLLDELSGIAQRRSFDDAAVIRAAQCYAAIRKEFA
ncbi:MAG: DUF4350 domain-containing protein [Candidatus Eremiobacteraeota bacterium]|nr:DUF4350 domain-containing protein [Candidatus Eremiobacteraeota bacterium]